jgi:glycerol-3-phosphate O-acyltransferase / dihydroxyacetone phosphate acyltransferase
LWEDERNIPLKNFVEISQAYVPVFMAHTILVKVNFISLVDLFSASTTHTWPRSQLRVRACLIKYLGYLHYTGINHSSLVALYPTTTPHPTSKSAAAPLPSAKVAFLVFIVQLLTTVLHPRAIFFLPPFLVHIPAYVLARLSVRFIATPGEEEGEAQFKTVFGGLGKGLGYAGTSVGLLMWLERLREKTGTLGSWSQSVTSIARDTLNSPGIVGALGKMGLSSFKGYGGGFAGVLKWMVSVVGVTYGTGSIFSRWHNALFLGEFRVSSPSP